MRGAHPSEQEGVVDRTGCVNFDGRNNGCTNTIPIQVKNCNSSSFFVYKLQPPFGCSIAYCAGSKKPCPKGQAGIFPVCTVLKKIDFPSALLSVPNVTYLDNGEPDVTLTCGFDFPKSENVSFKLQWIVNGGRINPAKQICISNDSTCSERHGSLTSRDYGPGDWVQCTLRARYNTHHLNNWTRETFSELFFAGIEIRPSNISLNECRIAKNQLQLRPTIPIRDGAWTDGITLMFGTGNGNAVLTNQCEINFPNGSLKWKNISVQAVCDNQDKGSSQSAEFTFFVSTVGHSFWSNYKLPTVLVTKVEKKNKLCTATGDPHYTTFDGRYYNFYQSGDYVLYRSKESKFEIHTRLWYCSQSVTCNCGVAIREHNDVIVLNSCTHDLRMVDGMPVNVRITSNGTLTRGTRIRSRHPGGFSEYEVRLPSGRRVTLRHYSWGNDVDLEAVQGDSNSTEGMCGNFNDDPGDDFNKGGDGMSHSDADSFGESWRVNTSESLFDTVPEPCEGENCSNNELNIDRCNCEKKHGQMSIKCDLTIMEFNEIPKNPPFKDTGNDEASRKKRANSYSDMVIYHYDDEEPDFPAPLPRRRRDVHLMSADNATKYCTETILSTPTAKACYEIAGINASNSIKQCSEDLQITGDLMWVKSAFENMKAGCQLAAVRNVSGYDKDEKGNLVPPVKIVKTLCPNDCSRNGNCTNGTCVCNKDYVAADCSMRFDEIPRLFRVLDKGLCDIRARPCMKTIVFGKHFLSSENLTCHIKEFSVVPSNWIPSNTTFKLKGAQTDLFAIACNLPHPPINLNNFDLEGTPALGYTVSVSNDGVHESEILKMITLDSVCQKCDFSHGCTLKNDSCLIRGHCFAEEAPNPKDWCQQCIPSVNQTMWTKRLVNLPPNITTPALRYAILGEDLQLKIEGKDPENRPFVVSMMDGSPLNAQVTDRGVLLWKPVSVNATKFYFKATDECNSSSTFNMTIEIVTCPCTDKGVCIPDSRHPRGSGMYVCKCQPGYEGQLCEQEIDECLSAPCIHGACTDQINNYSCQCEDGYVGFNCDAEIDECKSSPCVNGTCSDLINGFNCTCQLGFSGLRCEENINDCFPFPCGNGTCIDHVNNYTCKCSVGFTGLQCEVIITHCNNTSCYPGVTCLQKSNSISCGACPLGFTGDGKNCEDIDNCMNVTCNNDGTCMDGINNYTCSCHVGFTGDHCETDIDDCLNRACNNGGSCVDGVNNYTCLCQAGFAGEHCETDIDDCFNRTCGNGGSCVDSINSYSCVCQAGFTGDHCQTDIDDCVNHTCINGGSCVDQVNSYTCVCQAGFTGDHCESDIDNCVNHTCHNGGSCVDGVNNYTCLCQAGFTGDRCETDIDDCVNRTCDNGSICVDSVNNYSCVCQAGFTGDHCQTDINYCLNATCWNGGSCVDGVINYTCFCHIGFLGDHCETDIDDCLNRTCNNGGSCVDGVNSYTCLCQAGFAGEHCETDIDDCVNHTCNNGGSCVDSVNSHSCVCQAGFTGDHCQTDDRLNPSTDGNSDITTVIPTSRSAVTEKLSEFLMEIRIKKHWNEDLRDKKSDTFKNMSSLLRKEIWKAYAGNTELEAVDILSFSPGSVVAEFQLLFKTAVNEEKALAPLKKEVEDGKLGSLVVEPDSLKKKTNGEGKTPEKNTNLPMIIGISCAAFFLVAIVTVWCVRHHLRSGAQKTGPCSSQIPNETAFRPDYQKYEMKVVHNKEKLAWSEQGSNWNSGME